MEWHITVYSKASNAHICRIVFQDEPDPYMLAFFTSKFPASEGYGLRYGYRTTCGSDRTLVN